MDFELRFEKFLRWYLTYVYLIRYNTYKFLKYGWTMKTTLNIPRELIEEAVQLSGVRTKTEAVTLALKELIRQQKIERLIEQAGSLEFSDDWEDARHGR